MESIHAEIYIGDNLIAFMENKPNKTQINKTQYK